MEESEALYLRALSAKEKTLGPDHTSTLGTVNNLGNVYLGQGKIEEAEALYLRALSGQEKGLGPEHTSTLDTVHNLGNLYSNQGKMGEAEAIVMRKEAAKHFELVVQGYTSLLGPGRPETVDASSKLKICQADPRETDANVSGALGAPELPQSLGQDLAQLSNSTSP